MYLIVKSVYIILLITVLCYIPVCHTACDKMYLILEEYYGNGYREFRPIPSGYINWTNVDIVTNVANLLDFKKECVAELNCLGFAGDCTEKALLPKLYGKDERYTYTESVTDDIYTTPTTDGVVVELEITTETDIETTTDTDFITTTDDIALDPKTTTAKVHITTEEAYVIEEKDKDNKTDRTEIVTEKSIERPKDITDMDDIEVFVDRNTNRTNATDEKSGKIVKDTITRDPKASRYLATEIIMGILLTVASLAIIYMAKEYILNCLQSDTYNVEP